MGRHLVPLLVRDGYQLVLANRGMTSPDFAPSIPRYTIDRTIEGGLEDLTQSSDHFDAVVDLNAFRPKELVRSFEALAGKFKRYILLSSVDVYADRFTTSQPHTILLEHSKRINQGEETYGQLKADCEKIAEKICGAMGIPLVILRPTILIGEYDHTQRLRHWCSRVITGEADLPPAVSQQMVPLLPVIDVVNAIRFSLRQRFGALEHFNIAPKESLPIGRLLAEIKAQTNGKARARTNVGSANYAYWRQHQPNVLIDRRRSVEILGLSYSDQTEGLKQAIQWELAQMGVT